MGSPSHSTIPSLQVIIESQAGFPVLYSFPLAICFTHGSVYLSMLLSQFVPPFCSPAVSTSPFSTSVSLFLPYKQVHQYHFSRFHIHVLIHNMYFSLSYFTLFNRLQVHPPHLCSLKYLCSVFTVGNFHLQKIWLKICLNNCKMILQSSASLLSPLSNLGSSL